MSNSRRAAKRPKSEPRYNAEQELSIFRQFAEAAGQGFGMGSFDGRILYVNPAMARLLGEESPEAVIGQSFKRYYPEDWLKRRREEMLPALERDGFWDGEQVVLTRDGRAIPTWHHAFLLRDEHGKPIRRAFIVTDITEHKRAAEALQREHRTLKRLLQSSDHERQLIAYEIHDGLAQQLAGAIMQFQTYASLKASNRQEADKAFKAGMTMLRQGHGEARRLISGVRPPILDEFGIIAAVAHLVNEQQGRKGPIVEFHGEVGFDRLAPLLENAIYRIVQEGLANACKHSRSKRVRVDLVQRGETLRITIQDRGIGFDPEKVEEEHFGLDGIRQRARLLGGSAVVTSAPKKGTSLVVELPLITPD